MLRVICLVAISRRYEVLSFAQRDPHIVLFGDSFLKTCLLAEIALSADYFARWNRAGAGKLGLVDP